MLKSEVLRKTFNDVKPSKEEGKIIP